MENTSGKQEIGSLFVLVLFTLFAGCILMVLLLGASVYEEVVARDSQAFDARTGVQYIAAKLRHGDEAGCVQVGAFSDRTNEEADEIPTLYLRISAEGEFYYTKIYYYDGYIRELFTSADSGLLPVDGEKILEARELNTADRYGLLEITVTAEDGSSKTITLMLRSGGTGSMKEGTG